MKSKALILIALVLACSVFAQENSQHETKEMAHHEIKGDEPKHTEADGGAAAGGGGGAGSYSAGFSPLGGVYGGGQICKWGCCSESFGYTHLGGGYYGCTCCATLAEAEAYKDTQIKAGSKN